MEEDINKEETIGETFTTSEMLSKIWWIRIFTICFKACGCKYLKNDV